jgi:putative glutamine amidotransferase
VGIPWRTSQEQREAKRNKLDHYFRAVKEADAEPVEISLELPPEQLEKQLKELDAFVLPGSPADVDPARYGADRHPKTKTLDPQRDNTDAAILAHALKSSKPVLAICYGCQMLNVHLRGTLIQDLRSLNPVALPHGHTDLPPGEQKGDARHAATFEPDSRLARLNGAADAEINSSHHQAIDRPGENLRIIAHAPDGTIEGIEWTGDSNWVVGVQWHPERMPADDVLSKRLFEDFVAAAKCAHTEVASRK